jgi:hypothetical protein
VAAKHHRGSRINGSASADPRDCGAGTMSISNETSTSPGLVSYIKRQTLAGSGRRVALPLLNEALGLISFTVDRDQSLSLRFVFFSPPFP